MKINITAPAPDKILAKDTKPGHIYKMNNWFYLRIILPPAIAKNEPKNDIPFLSLGGGANYQRECGVSILRDTSEMEFMGEATISL